MQASQAVLSGGLVQDMEKRATSSDVARRAKVSRATVSYVLNCVPHKSISPQTRERVLRAAAELSYVPNSAARRLKTDRAYRIAVRLATALNSPRYYEALQGIRSHVESLGYTILLCNDRAAAQRQSGFIDACQAGGADGIIYIASDHTGIARESLEEIERSRIPLSTIDCMGDDERVSSVTYDYRASSTIRVTAALRRGFTRFIYVRPSFDNEKERAREQGFLEAVERAGSQWRIETYEGTDRNQSDEDGWNAGRTPAATIEAACAWVAEAPRDTCFVCSSPEFQNVIGSLLRDQHLVDPAGDVGDWRFRSPSYRYDHFAAGIEAASTLLGLLEDEQRVRKLVMEPELVPAAEQYALC